MAEFAHKDGQKGFSRLAGIYDFFAALGTLGAIQRSQRDHWEHLPQGGSVFIVGGGTGRLLPDIIGTCRPESLTFVEPSEGMRRRAERRLQTRLPEWRDRITWHSGALPDFLPEGQYDLIILPFVLDLFDEAQLRASLAALDVRLKAGGTLLFCDFRMPPRGIARLWAKLQIGLLYRFFRMICAIPARKLPDFDAAFTEGNWHTAAERRRFGGLIQSRLLRREGEKEGML